MNNDNLIKEIKGDWKNKYNPLIIKAIGNVDINKFIIVDISRDSIKFDSSNYMNEIKREIERNVRETKFSIKATVK